MKTILLHIHEDSGQEGRLQFALDLARSMEGHLICAQITPFEYLSNGGEFYGGVMSYSAIIESMREQERAEQSRIEAHLQHEDVSWDWQKFDGNTADILARHSVLADVIVLSQMSHDKRSVEDPLPVVADVATHARAPVFVVPPQTKSFDPTGAALVAWNGSPESAHALQLAVPILQNSSEVNVLEVSDDTKGFAAADAALYLAHHKIRCNTSRLCGDGKKTSDVLLHSALELKTAYIVMGAYGHSRLRETILGGVTRDMLANSEVPLLIAH